MNDPLDKMAENARELGIQMQPAHQEPVALGALAKRRIFDYIRGAYDLGYNDARNARAIPGDGAPGYKGRDVEADHGSALLHALEAITSPPAQHVTDEQVEAALKAACMHSTPESRKDMRRAIEAAHGIKENT